MKKYLDLNDKSGYFYFEEIGSTNTFLKENEKELKNGAICVTKNQTHGRGTKNRKWVLFKDNFTISFLLKDLDTYNLNFFPILCGLISKECVDNLSGCKSYIKWPNDIILNGKKVVGILLESIIYKDKASLICGSGINLNVKKEEFLDKNLENGGSIFSQSGVYVPFKKAECEYIKTCNKYLNLFFDKKSLNDLKEIYKNNLITLNKEVKVVVKDKEIIAKAVDVDDYGRLVCEHKNNLIALSSNEATIRGTFGYI